jgi:intracellular septation protein
MINTRFISSLAIEFGPTILFFITVQVYGFLFGTAVLVTSTGAALATSLIHERRIPLFALISSGSVLLFGISTLASRDSMWIILEYTLYNAAFGLVLLLSVYFKRPLLKPLFSAMFLITDRGWNILTARWGIFFLVISCGNLIMSVFFSESVWVYYRLLSAITLCIFGFSQFFLARKERLPHASPWGLHP